MPAVKLTERHLREILRQPREKPLVLYDADEAGFGVRISPRGKLAYFVEYRPAGRTSATRRFTIRDAGNLIQARQRAREEKLNVGRGLDPQVRRQAEHAAKLAEAQAETTTFKKVAERYIELRAKPRQRTWKETQRLFERELYPHWGDTDVAAITARMIRQRVVAIRDGEERDRAAPALAERVLQVAIRPLFAFAIEREWIDADPAASVKVQLEHGRRQHALGDAELRTVWEKADTLPTPWGAFVRLLILTGCRRGEVAGLQRDELAPDLATWLLPAERSKNGRPHLVPLPQAARDVITSVPKRAGGFLFAGRGKAPIGNFSKMKTKLDELLGDQVRPWVWHDLRRSVATGMARIGIRPDAIEACLNHVSGHRAGVAGTYNVHQYEKEKKQALAAWARHVKGLGEPKSNVVQMRRK